jgi:trimeric autotransporter adhesin
VGNFTATDTLDVAVATSGGLASVLLGNGNGTLQNQVKYTIGLGAVAIATGDMNSSGHLSLITANETDNTTSLLIGNGNGTFKSQSIFPTNGAPVGLAIGDFNQNGKLDIAAIDNTGNFASVQLDSLLTLSPTINSFGTITSGDPSAAKTITLKNNGTTAYTMGTIATVGSSGSDFSIESSSTCPTTTSLAAGASCTFLNVFDPALSEFANAQVQVTSSGGSMIAYQETGTGNVPIMMNPRTITFAGYQLVGTTSAAKTTTFTNVSGVTVTFTSLILSGVNENQFSQTTTCNIPGTLAPGASCTSNIYFVPTVSGTASVTAIYNGDFTVGRAGTLVTAEATAVKVTPTKLTFPNTTVGDTSKAMTFSFENAGSVALPITSVGWTGTEPYFSETNTCQPSVPATTTCTFSVTFTPLTTGTFTATLSIGNSDPTGPQQITVTGTGIAAAGGAVRVK